MSRDVDRARSLQNAGRSQESLEIVARRLASHPDDVEALAVAADALGALGERRRELDTAEMLLARRPDDVRGLTHLANAHAALLHFGSAEQAIQELLRAHPHNWFAHYTFARIRLVNGDESPTTLSAAQQAVHLNPQNASAQTVLGDVYRAQNRYRDAIAAYRAALRLNPLLEPAINNLALALLRSRRPVEAVRILIPLLRINPRHPAARVNVLASSLMALSNIRTIILLPTAIVAVINFPLLETDGTNANADSSLYVPSIVITCLALVASYGYAAWFVSTGGPAVVRFLRATLPIAPWHLAQAICLSITPPAMLTCAIALPAGGLGYPGVWLTFAVIFSGFLARQDAVRIAEWRHAVMDAAQQGSQPTRERARR